ncbi:MAG: hypothetical protein RIE77_10890 [Phycisphaerales bacterium]|jgi:hypothetical protein
MVGLGSVATLSGSYTFATLTRLRPTLFHITARSNLEHIQRTRRLRPAVDIFAAAGTPHLSRARRARSVVVECDGQAVHVRDESPLYEKNCGLAEGWTFADLVQHLNEHVFFWPGGDKPIQQGLNHFGRYSKDDCVVLVLPTAQVFAANPEPRFSACNSGSPRHKAVNGKGVPGPRGPDTFRLAEDFDGTPGKVVEVVFRGAVSLEGCDIEVREPSDFV